VFRLCRTTTADLSSRKKNQGEERVPTGFIRSVVAIVAVWLASCAAIAAQDYPTRTIRVIIPLGPGGGGDVFTRALADELQKALGQPVVVENRTGGALNIGTRACAEAAPDGYTICVLSSEPVVYNQFLFKGLPFDPEKDFEPISNLFFNTLALVVNSSLKVRTISDLVALSKAQPGRLSYGTFSFPLAHFMEKLKKETGTDIVRVPFWSGNEVVTALLSGSTPVAILALSNMVLVSASFKSRVGSLVQYAAPMPNWKTREAVERIRPTV
jgi:tripartite-type tricarboxylate transporter receptor subunit TctC